MTQIATIVTAPAAPGTTGVTAALNNGATGMFGGAGMSFMDMIFARSIANTGASAVLTTPVVDSVKGEMTAAQALAATKAIASGLSQSDLSLIAADLTAAGIDPASLESMLVELSTEGTLSADTIIMTAQNGETATGAVTTAEPPLSLSAEQLAEAMKILRSMMQALPADNALQSMSADPALIAAPLTPAELTKMIEDLAAKIKSASPTISITATKGAAQDNTELLQDDSALNAAISGGIIMPPMQTQLNATIEERSASARPGEGSIDMLAGVAQPGKPTMMPGGYVPNAAVNDAGIQNNAAKGQSGAGGSAVAAGTAGTLSMTDSLLNSAGWDSIYPDGLEWTQQGHTGGQSLSVTGTAQFASLVSQAQSATAPHPATQMVAAQITKGAAEGETKTMTLKLDPPELGRIEIRMDFGKEKGMKAHLVVEKQETYLMLQRDAHVLERALQDAGIGAEDGGLSFELAQDNLFNDGHDGSNRHAGGSDGSADNAADEPIIESTMTWSVDAETGMTHYDILA